MKTKSVALHGDREGELMYDQHKQGGGEREGGMDGGREGGRGGARER